MKTILIFALAVCLFDITRGADSGKYRPDIYNYDGQYQPNYYDGRYNNYFGRYQDYFGRNGYYPNYNDFYQPSYYNNLRPYQQLLSPYSSFGKSTGSSNNLLGTQKSAAASTASAVTTAAPQIKAATSQQAAVVAAVPSVKQAVVPTVNNYYPRYNGYEGNARIIAQDNDLEANGYHYSYQTENGISAGEKGAVASNSRSGGTVVSGFYEYVGDDGQLYRVDYTADENGFHPTGKHLP